MRDQMVREWGLQDFSPQEQDEYIAKIGEVLYQSIALRATEQLDDAQLAELDAMAVQKGEAMDAAQALDWLRVKVPNFDAIAAEESSKLKERILAVPQ